MKADPLAALERAELERWLKAAPISGPPHARLLDIDAVQLSALRSAGIGLVRIGGKVYSIDD